ncbi:MAG: 2-hydroxyacid dehydrogenase [Phycisphaerales bacterium]
MDQPVIASPHPVPGQIAVPGTILRQGDRHKLSRPELLEFVRGASVIVSMFYNKIDAEVLDAAGPQLKGVCNYAVGYDNIDLAACRQRGIKVTNTPGAVTEGTADIAWTLLLAAARGLIPADRFARSPEYKEHGPLGITEFLGMDLTGRTLLIVGAGRIGYATAVRSIGWGMRVLYVARARHLDFELAPLAARRVTLEEGLAEADVVSIHTPLTPETRHLFNTKTFGLMKSNAILINTSRGPVVEEAALVEALKSGRIYAAGLDVFEFEPAVGRELAALDNVVLTPHIGSAETKYRLIMTEMVSENAGAILAGREPPNRIG